ncbi:MAG: Anthranilate synthase component 1 [Alphaproteobacteria bacterium MarineAlpha2_Bin1]|nr:MAG: Anthranilate synthase component 1 [Alphaproteobacteria bacterium MarineAlpha2_Bin1]
MEKIFETKSGINIYREVSSLSDESQITSIIEGLDENLGVYLSSGVEFPDRYSQWDFGIIDPPLMFTGTRRKLIIETLNERGEDLLNLIKPIFLHNEEINIIEIDKSKIILEILYSKKIFTEEERSLQPSIFTPLRSIMHDFLGIGDQHLGLYGAFGFDLIYQFEKPNKDIDRLEKTNILKLFLPDEIFIYDRKKELMLKYRYYFTDQNNLQTNKNISLRKEKIDKLKNKIYSKKTSDSNISVDLSDDKFSHMVNLARDAMRKGDIFEVVLSRSFKSDYYMEPSVLFNQMKRVNPSPYEFFLQFGDEQIIGTSPEMFVRVEGTRVESCPISGTVKRGLNPMEDEQNIRKLLNSEKDEVELTMCTDVDRNDKSRICKPGTINLIDRRMIERYAGLFHTVDHVEGQLRENFSGLDAFLSHMWAVTLTGAPKKAAVSMIEKLESSPREWYGGAVGALFFNGNVNTGITIRTVHLKDNKAIYRAGATLVWDSKGEEEAEETRIKADAFFKIINFKKEKSIISNTPVSKKNACVVMLDNEDSFIHTLADYIRQNGAKVFTFRSDVDLENIIQKKPDLVVHSPGPGVPHDFKLPSLILKLADLKIPQFGVCLGMQGMAEAFGGELSLLSEPRHGKRWIVHHDSKGIFENIQSPCEVGAYHSIVVKNLPDDFLVTARTEEGLIMGISHKKLPIFGLQFHPESILSLKNNVGHKIVSNIINTLNIEN